MSEEIKLPGEKIAMIEEYLPGNNTFEDGDSIRATSVGSIEFNKSEQLVSVQKRKSISIPNVGDVIIGTVAASLGSMIAVSIDYINEKPTTSKVECVCGTRNLRIRNVALVNDIVALKIINHLNGTIHAAISEPELGTLFTKCRKCGGKVVSMRDAIKCTECSWIDERKLSSNFGKSNFVKLRE